MKEKLTIEVIDKYLRDKGWLKDNEQLDGFFIQLNKNKEPEELFIDWVSYPTDEEIEKRWKEYDESYSKPDKVSKDEYVEYLEDRLTEAIYDDQIPEEDSKYLLENYDLEHLLSNPMYCSGGMDEIQEWVNKEFLK